MRSKFEQNLSFAWEQVAICACKASWRTNFPELWLGSRVFGFTYHFMAGKWWSMKFMPDLDCWRSKIERCVFEMCADVIITIAFLSSGFVSCVFRWIWTLHWGNCSFGDFRRGFQRMEQWNLTFAPALNCKAGKSKQHELTMWEKLFVGLRVSRCRFFAWQRWIWRIF